MNRQFQKQDVALCRDGLFTSQLTAPGNHFGAKVCCSGVERESMNNESERKARPFAERVCSRRLHRQGRRTSGKWQ